MVSKFENRNRAIRLSYPTVFAFFLFLAMNALGDLPNTDVDKSLENGSNSVWFDTKESKLRFPSPGSLQAGEDALDDRHRYIYEELPVASTSTNWDWWDDFAQFLSSLVLWLLWGGLAAFVVGVVVYLWLAAQRGWYIPLRRKLATSDELTSRDRAKLVDLPFNIDIPSQGLFEQAEGYRRSGEYSKAIVYLFSHVLVELDAADCIRLQRGKTNRVYLNELKSEPHLAKLHQHLVHVFEAVFFGRYSIGQEQCDRYWNLLPAIKQSIQQAKDRRTNSDETDIPAPDVSGTLPTTTGAMKLGLFLSIGVLGCRNASELPLDNYGDSNNHSRKSVSGLTVLRELCERQGRRTIELTNLSQRTHKLQTILWAPKDFRVPNEREIYWFDEWLSDYPSRTLIFVGRDYSPFSHYWSKAAEGAAPEDRRMYRLQKAFADAALETARLQAESHLRCDWFELRLEPAVSHRVESFEGPWSQELQVSQADIELRGALLPRSESRTSKPPSQILSDSGSTSDTVDTAAEVDATASFDLSESVVEYGVPTIETLLASADGTPIISSISYKAWGQSRLILVANGSMTMNESLVNPGNRQVAKRLIAECTLPGRVGFLSNSKDTRIRLPWDDDDPKGFEWLRVWPLSLIAIQGLFLGSIALLAMLPIFGRPQRLPAPSTTDFGKHIEALGDLLAQSRDRNYALQRIAEYFRDVRGDSANPWSMVAPPSQPSSGPERSKSLPTEAPSNETPLTETTSSLQSMNQHS